MYRTMLVPLDGSMLAEEVLPYANELAIRLGLELILLHVCEPKQSESKFMCKAYIEGAAEIIKKQPMVFQTKERGTQLKEKVIEARTEVVEGNPAEEIVDYASENKADLILMATHGRSGIRRWVLGSTVDRVLRASEVPVWLIRAGIPEDIVHDKWPQRTMLVPLDGSPMAESVLPYVEALARQRGSDVVRVFLIRIFEQPFITADYPEASLPLSWGEHVKRVTEHSKQVAEQYLKRIQKRLEYVGLKVSSKVLMGGKPANGIINYAQENSPNLIVMATHGYSGISRWEYGSVADKVLYGVSSPIFLVRTKQS